MRDILSRLHYPGKDVEQVRPDPAVAFDFSADCIERIDWSDRSVHVDLSRGRIKRSAAFDAAAPVDRDYV